MCPSYAGHKLERRDRCFKRNDFGEEAFGSCRGCHAVEADAPSGAGPNLAGLAGRRLGGDPKFDYSPVLRAAFASGAVWDAERLDRFLADPEAMFPGMWMSARGISDAIERSRLVDLLMRGVAK